MANERAIKDPNHVPALLIHDSTGTETRQVRGSLANPNALPIEMSAGGSTTLAGLSAGSLNADLLPSTDVSGYRWFSVQITGTWNGTITLQGSNDNTNWLSVAAQDSSSTLSPARTSAGGSILSHGAIGFKYLRIRMTSYSSGTAAGVVLLSTLPSAFPAYGVAAAQSGTWTFTHTRPSTAAVTSVNDTASSTTLLSSNSNRREAIIQNDSTSILYVKFGTTASSTDYTMKLGTDDVLTTEYTGRIDGIWSADASGAAKITELT